MELKPCLDIEKKKKDNSYDIDIQKNIKQYISSYKMDKC